MSIVSCLLRLISVAWPLLLQTAMKKILGPLWILQALLGASAIAEDSDTERPTLILGQGEQRLLRFPGLTKYSLGSSVVRVLPLSPNFGFTAKARHDSLLIKAVTPGLGDLWVWKQDGSSEHRTIRVEKLSRSEHADPATSGLEKSLSKLQEVEVVLTGQKTVLRGEILTLGESARVHSLAEAFPQQIHDETELSFELLDQGEKQLNQWLKRSGYSTQLRTEQVGQSLWLRGNVNHASLQLAVEKQARTIFPMIQTEIDSLPDHAPTVYFRVFLLELKRSQFHSLGLSWPALTAGAFKVTTGSIQDLLQIDLTLQQLEGNGNAKILSNPELVVRAPGEAELFAGGEIPIQMQSQYYSNVSWKKYGLILRLKCTHVAGERVRLDIYTEVSHLDNHISQGQVPGIQANRMKTQVDAKFGTPLLLSGLLQQGIREEAKGLPFLRGIPILGVLFGSEDYLNERSELVAILYPHATPPPPPFHLPHLVPRGLLPAPRNWITPSEMRAFKESKDYPWNTLE